VSFAFKIWNQANNGTTMGIRVASLAELRRIAASHQAPDANHTYGSISDYLTTAGTATRPPRPYMRPVDVFWDTTLGYGGRRYFDGRTLEVTYSGNQRRSGGFAAQCYVIVDPQGYSILGPFHLVPIRVDVVAGNERDLLVVTV
jgi:hypothetical protein